MISTNFKHHGTFQQLSGLFVRVGRLVDGIVIFLTLYFLVALFDAGWDEIYLAVSLIAILCFEVTASFFEFYRSWRITRLRYEILEIFLYWSFTVLFVTFLLYSFDGRISERADILYWWFALSFLEISVFRCALRFALRYARAFGFDHRIAAFAGATDVALSLNETFCKYPWMGIKVNGFFDDRLVGEERPLAISRDKLAGNTNDLVALAERGEIDIVYISLPMAAERRVKDLIDRFSNSTVSVYYCPSFFEFDLLNGRMDNVYGQPVISVIESPFRGYVGLTKRAQDLFLSMLIMPLIIVPMLVIAVLIKLTSSGPVFYRQKRYGLDGKEFEIWKFRTMYTCDKTEKFVQATKDDPRVTPLGRFLRKTSLDELPQFINVLMGDMSVIGPRPHPIKLNEMHRKAIRRYMVRHKIKPGITGFAQVSGYRGETDCISKMEKRIEHDLYYIKNWSFWLDIKIFVKTFFSIFFDRNAY